MVRRESKKISSRIDAAVAAVRISQLLNSEPRFVNDVGVVPWTILSLLRWDPLDHLRVRAALDALLDVQGLQAYGTGTLRLRVAQIESALKLPHDARSAEAFVAEQSGFAAFNSYVDTLAPVEIEIPVRS